MNKKEAEKQFKESFELKKNDYCYNQLAWTGFIDGLCKDGQITQTQFFKWDNPKFLNHK